MRCPKCHKADLVLSRTGSSFTVWRCPDCGEKGVGDPAKWQTLFVYPACCCRWLFGW